MSLLLSRYMSFYSKSPYVASFGTCLVKGAVADGIAQTQIEKTEKFCIRRNALFALWSAAYCGCAQVRRSYALLPCHIAVAVHSRELLDKICRLAVFSTSPPRVASRSTTFSTLLSVVHSERRPVPQLRCKRQLRTRSSRPRCSASQSTTRASQQLRAMLAKGHSTVSESTRQVSQSSTSSQPWSGSRRTWLRFLLSPRRCESRGQQQSQSAGCRLFQ